METANPVTNVPIGLRYVGGLDGTETYRWLARAGVGLSAAQGHKSAELLAVPLIGESAS